MKYITLYFQVHQPSRLRTYRFFDIGADHYYYDDYQNKRTTQRIAENCYLPTNEILLELIKKYGSAFKVCFSITGTAIEQFQKYAPEVIKSFQKLAKTGNVEFLGETYSHSLASLKYPNEFRRQVKQHSELMKSLFNYTPTAFRNTELIFSDQIAEQVWDMGFRTILTEGAKQTLGWKSPNFLYCSAHNEKMKILLRNYQLSDDISFRFSQQDWSEWPLTAEKYLQWLNEINPKQELVNIFMDYETFGEHQKAETGIFEFLKAFPQQTIASGKWSFKTPSEVAVELSPVASISVDYPISWADEEKDLTAWLGNDMQKDAFESLYSLADIMEYCDDAELVNDWNHLQVSDHFYYMCTKWFSDGMVHHYFSPFDSPYNASINYMNIISDFIERVKQYQKDNPKGKAKIKDDAPIVPASAYSKKPKIDKTAIKETSKKTPVKAEKKATPVKAEKKKTTTTAASKTKSATTKKTTSTKKATPKK
ncbi:MAG: glycoside hydrolase family 57 protein [Bacteroidales bacterium]|jgi:alpha-amylase